jgi:hypothetical protein
MTKKKKVTEIQAENVKLVKAELEKAEKKAPGFAVKEKNSWNHQIGSMGSRLDDLLEKGMTIADAAKILMKEFDRTEDAATKKAALHFSWMLKNHPKKISYDEATKKFKSNQKSGV